MYAIYDPENGASLPSSKIQHGPTTILHTSTLDAPDNYSGSTTVSGKPVTSLPIPNVSDQKYNGAALISSIQDTINSIQEKNAMSTWSSSSTQSSGISIAGYTISYEAIAIIAVIAVILILIFR